MREIIVAFLGLALLVVLADPAVKPSPAPAPTPPPPPPPPPPDTNETICPSVCDKSQALICGLQRSLNQFKNFTGPCKLTEFNCNHPTNRYAYYSALPCSGDSNQ